MYFLTKLLKKIGKWLLIFPLFVLSYLLAAWIFASLPVNQAQPKGEITLFLVSNGVHTDVVMPLKNEIFDWTSVVNPADTITDDANIAYVGLGWGERNFYLYTPEWKDLSVSSALGALSGLNRTLIHITYYNFESKEDDYIVKFSATSEQYQRLTKLLSESFKQEDGKSILLKGIHYQSNDAFYEAKGRYHLFNTCNTWLNDRLVESGLKGVYWTPFSSPLLDLYR